LIGVVLVEAQLKSESLKLDDSVYQTLRTSGP